MSNTAQIDKPLNQSQVKNLKEIIEGDYSALQERLTNEINDRANKKRDEVRERYSDRMDVETARKQLRDAVRKAEDELKAFIAQLEQDGFGFDSGRFLGSPMEMSVRDDRLIDLKVDEEMDKIDRAMNRLKQAVSNLVARERHAALRQVLLQSIDSQGALDLLADVPNESDLMALVISEIELTKADEVRSLMTKEEIKQAKALEKRNGVEG